ncbi:TlyA family rRNA (cytidine-2'-O)-methyltransferase [Candidatus Microgenomates bacterium]|nr:TlyA family rRNA (cytidine-2'-O)-methyltransferase [Candidatus Microgenomates bacterium]
MKNNFVSRAGEKLQFALDSFDIKVKDLICADFGSSTGGFVDCLLQNGASKVYAVETGYGVLDWNLRNDSRVVVMEKTNAMHVSLPQKVDFISIDASWTKQKLILPNAFENLKEDGVIISLIKPHYEAPKEYLKKGRLIDEKIDEVVQMTKQDIEEVGAKVLNIVESPILGEKGKNKEFLALITRVGK